jgi:hypothetical protein
MVKFIEPVLVLVYYVSIVTILATILHVVFNHIVYNIFIVTILATINVVSNRAIDQSLQYPGNHHSVISYCTIHSRDTKLATCSY